MPGLLRSQPKIDEAELELARSRTAARLAEIFVVDAPSSEDLTHADAPTEAVEVDQAREEEQPLEIDAAVRTERRGGLPPAIVIELPPALVGVMAEPNTPSLDDQPEPDRADAVGVMVGQDPASPVGPGEESRIRADTYVLAQAFDIARVAVPIRAADASVGEEPRNAAVTQLVFDDGLDDGRQAGQVEGRPAAPRDVVSDIESPKPRKASRRTSEPRSPKGGQLHGARSRDASAPRATMAKTPRASSAFPASCPYCALLLQPPPESSRRCPRCRQRIIVKSVDGRAVYLTEAALLVFDSERRRSASSRRWTKERKRWLKLAIEAGAPPQRAARLAAAQLSEDAVEAARTLYMTTVERSFRVAKRDRRWDDASRIRREQAMALFRVAGSPLTPPEGIVELARDGVAAELRGLAEITRDAELVSAACCDSCKADDGRIYRITQELREPRRPHLGCPKGLCRCRWDLAARDQTTVRRYLRHRARTRQRNSSTESGSRG